MKSFLLVAVVFAVALVVGISCEDGDKFARLCNNELKAFKSFDDFQGNENEKDVLFWKWLKARKDRIGLAKILSRTCDEQVDDKQILNNLCADEQLLESHASQNPDKTLQARLAKMANSAGWRRRKFANQLWFETSEKLPCPASPSSNKYADLQQMLDRIFREQCKKESFNDHIRSKIPQLTAHTKLDLSTTHLKKAQHDYEDALESRLQFCAGSIETCCQEQWLEEARGEASVRVAQILLDMVEDSSQLYRLVYEQERQSNYWDARFGRVCALEGQLKAGSPIFPARPATLSNLHEQARKVRETLGKRLGQDTCPVDSSEHLSAGSVQQVEVDAACEPVKAQVVCQFLENANDFHNFKQNGPVFQRRRADWCSKSKDAAHKLKKNKCPDEAPITREALVEAQVSYELLELDDGSDRLDMLRRDVLNVAREEYVTLHKCKEIITREISEQKDEARKEKSREALKLITDKLTQLWNQTTS